MSEITCPKCQSTEIHLIGKRNALYPAGCLYLLGLAFAMLHQVQSPIEYRCKACDEKFAKRTGVEKFALGLLIVTIILIVGFIGFYVWEAFTVS